MLWMPKFNSIPVFEFMSALRFQLLSVYCENSNISPNFIHGYKLHWTYLQVTTGGVNMTLIQPVVPQGLNKEGNISCINILLAGMSIIIK